MHTVNIFQLAFGVWKSTLKVSGKTKKKMFVLMIL